MGLGHMLRQRGEPAFSGGSDMGSHSVASEEGFHGMLGEPDVELMFDQGIGHRVVMAIDLDVIIDVDPGPFPVGIDVRLNRERLQRRFIQALEARTPAAGKFLERVSIEFFQQFPYGPVELA